MLFILQEGIRSLFRVKATSTLVVAVMSFALLTGGWFYILTGKLRSTSNIMESAMEIEAFLTDSAAADDIEQLQTVLEANPGVRSVLFISKDSAAAFFLKEVGKPIEMVMGENTLPPSFKIRLNPDVIQPEKIDSVIESFSELKGVEDVIARREYMLKLRQYISVFKWIHAVIGIAALLITLVLLMNATRLSMLSRKDSIEIMKLVGAGNSYIKGPFIIEGFFAGLISGCIACAVTWAIEQFLNAGNVRLSVSLFYYYALITAGCFLGIGGSNLAIRTYME